MNDENVVDVSAQSPRNPGHRSIMMVLSRRLPSILIITILFIAGAVLYIAKSTPIYTSTARLYVERSGPKIIGEYEGVMTGSKNYLYTQSELIKSTPIISDVVEQKDIKRLEILTVKHPSLGERLKKKIGLSEISSGDADNPVVYLKKMLDVKVGIKDDIIAVSCSSEYREQAAKVVNAVVDSYTNYHSTQKKSTVSEVLRILQKEKIARDTELNKQFDSLLDFTQQYGVVSFNKNGANAVFQRLKNLGDSLTEAQIATINTKASMEAVSKIAGDYEKVKQYAMSRPEIGSHIFNSDMDNRLRQELKDFEYELDSALMRYSQEHPAVVSLNEKISRVKAQLAEQLKTFTDAFIEVLDIEYQIAKVKEDQMKESYERQQAQAQGLNVKATEYMILETKLEQSKRFCEILDNRIKELNISEDVGALNINILEVARPAEIASSPQKAKIVMAALIIGVVFGIGFASARELVDCRLRGAEEISQMLDIPVLGIVPSMGKTKSVDKLGQRVHFEPKSLVAEAYRTIRTAIFFGVPKGEAKTILVTSPAPGDGKTTMVSNVAIAMAQAGEKTLIIDADFRKPMQHNIFGLKNEVENGLSSVLAGKVELDEAIIKQLPEEGLHILTGGGEVPNPSELLNSKGFTDVLKKLTTIYDRIIIDSPPVTAVADGQILAAISDITILVLRAEKSTRKLGLQARDALSAVSARVLGAVVNDVSRKQSKYGYYSHYGYYGYGYGRNIK
ncbi:MAG: polysaccharide biosynthesis tyrosine autokinase [Anaerohalosphaeraceae bacterium]|nr:polysaccharide biosynthesis tyrosine autokinase [Anaerohalosphaeraceae bacterium]